MMSMTGMAINAQVPDIDSAAIIINESGNFDPKATLRAEDRRRNSGELKWMELTVKQKNKKYRGVQNTCAPLTVLSVTRIHTSMSLVYNIKRH